MHPRWADQQLRPATAYFSPYLAYLLFANPKNVIAASDIRHNVENLPDAPEKIVVGQIGCALQTTSTYNRRKQQII
jgi:hypothetical protein